MLHKKLELEHASHHATRTTLGEEELGRKAGELSEYRISDKEAVRCALSIPEEFVPTPHKEFIKDLEVKQETNSKKQRPMLSPMKTSIQNGKTAAEYQRLGTSTSILVRDRERKLRSAFAKYKKWDEAERCTVERLEGNRILIDGELIMEINHTDYIKEQDVVLELDEDYRTCSMPPPPDLRDEEGCKAPSCRLGCICECISREPVVRAHCGKPRCFFDCNCSQSLFSNGDNDGDIRSRLRPRVSLLNWRFMEGAERDKETPPVNYRQLERGIAIYPRMRRVPVAPQRFRNEYIMSTKFKDTLNRERRKPVGITKFIRKPPTAGVKRDNASSIYRRNYLVKSSVKQKENSREKIPNIRPCSVSIDPMKKSVSDEDELDENPPEPPEQEPLEIPKLVHVVQRDGIILLMGSEQLCFLTFTLECKHPQAVVYKEKTDGEFICPWLYLPFTSSEESWIFHPIQLRDDESTFTCIPEINCVIPTRALRMHLNTSRTKKKTIALKMLWVGEDSKQRRGSIYLLPALPNVIICGPFPHYLMKTRFRANYQPLDRIVNICSYVDRLSTGRFAGDVESWNTFCVKKKEQVNAALQAELKKDRDTGITTDAVIPYEAYGMSPVDSPSGSEQEEPSSPEMATEPSNHPKSDKLCVSWNDAAKLLSVQQ